MILLTYLKGNDEPFSAIGEIIDHFADGFGLDDQVVVVVYLQDLIDILFDFLFKGKVFTSFLL
jgi:hypothetical protein